MTSALARERLKEVPDDFQAMRLAARSAARQDQDQRAAALYDRLAPGTFEAEDLFLWGRALVRGGKPEQGLKAVEAAREKDPDHPEALAVLAGLYLKSDRTHAAATTAERLARQPNWEAQAQLLLGTARSSSHDPAGAAEALLRWAELDPEGRVVAPYPVAQFRKLLARSLLEAQMPARARTVLEALLHAGPDPEASWLLSRTFIQEKDWKQAAVALMQAPNFRAENPLLPEPAPYVGETRCAECHRTVYDQVLASRHSTTFSRASELSSLSFPNQPLPDPGNPHVTHHFRHEGHSLVVETRSGEKLWRAVVEYALGSVDHFTTFVGRDDQGHPRMIRMSAYRSGGETGWDLATGLPPQPEHEDEYLGKRMFEGDGLRRCLNCHTTNPRAVLRGSGPESADRAIGCEQCHSPAGHHVAAVAARFSDLAIDSPVQASPAEVDRVCAKCHGNHQPERVGRPRTDPAWLRFESLSLSWSRCYIESDGSLGCVTCHDPHRNAETRSQWYDAKCLSCHASSPSAIPPDSAVPRSSGGKPRPGAETATARTTSASCPVSPTRDCVGCHLPRVWVPSTHSFKADHYIRIRDLPAAKDRPVNPAGRDGHE
jgi:tetratricopeptide (TPR) repeat protein